MYWMGICRCIHVAEITLVFYKNAIYFVRVLFYILDLHDYREYTWWHEMSVTVDVFVYLFCFVSWSGVSLLGFCSYSVSLVNFTRLIHPSFISAFFLCLLAPHMFCVLVFPGLCSQPDPLSCFWVSAFSFHAQFFACQFLNLCLEFVCFVDIMPCSILCLYVC